MRPWECSQTDRHTDRHTHTHTHANRFYNLSHAICYSYGTDKKIYTKIYDQKILSTNEHSALFAVWWHAYCISDSSRYRPRTKVRYRIDMISSLKTKLAHHYNDGSWLIKRNYKKTRSPLLWTRITEAPWGPERGGGAAANVGRHKNAVGRATMHLIFSSKIVGNLPRY